MIAFFCPLARLYEGGAQFCCSCNSWILPAFQKQIRGARHFCFVGFLLVVMYRMIPCDLAGDGSGLQIDVDGMRFVVFFVWVAVLIRAIWAVIFGSCIKPWQFARCVMTIYWWKCLWHATSRFYGYWPNGVRNRWIKCVKGLHCGTVVSRVRARFARHDVKRCSRNSRVAEIDGQQFQRRSKRICKDVEQGAHAFSFNFFVFHMFHFAFIDFRALIICLRLVHAIFKSAVVYQIGIMPTGCCESQHVSNWHYAYGVLWIATYFVQ